MYVIGERDPTTLTLGTIYGSIALFRVFDVFDLHFQARVLSKYTVWATTTSFLVVASTKLALISASPILSRAEPSLRFALAAAFLLATALTAVRLGRRLGALGPPAEMT